MCGVKDQGVNMRWRQKKQNVRPVLFSLLRSILRGHWDPGGGDSFERTTCGTAFGLLTALAVVSPLSNSVVIPLKPKPPVETSLILSLVLVDPAP